MFRRLSLVALLLLSSCKSKDCTEQVMSVPPTSTTVRKLSCLHKAQKVEVLEPNTPGAPRTLVCRCPRTTVVVPPKEN